MKEIKLIDKDTIIPKASPLDWDLEIKGRPQYIVKEKIVGKKDENNNRGV